MNINPRELNGLPSIIFSLWTFFSRGRRAAEILYDAVSKAEVKAMDMFTLSQTMVLVKQDYLPYDPNVKAAFVNIGRGKSRGRVYVETTLIDFEKVAERLHLSPLKYERLNIKGKTFLLDDEPFIQTRSQQHFGKTFSPRTMMWPIQSLTENTIGQYLEVAEFIYSSDCFAEDAKPKIAISAVAEPEATQQTMELQMSQQMVQLLSTEQRPLMSMNQLMMARLYHKQRILKLSGPELIGTIRRHLRENPALELG